MSPLLDEVVFVGGQIAPLYFTVAPVAVPRPTKDVDIVVSVASRTQLRKLEKRLDGLGLRNDTRPGAPICRWLTSDDIVVDVMPADAALLGFSNRWYPSILEHPQAYSLAEDLSILIPTAPLYLAAKWEAFLGRGANDPASTDLEDVIMVVAGRPEIVAEVAEAPSDVRNLVGAAGAPLPRGRSGGLRTAGRAGSHIEGTGASGGSRGSLSSTDEGIVSVRTMEDVS